MMMVNSSYVTASDQVAGQIRELNAILHAHDPNAYITGEAALTADLITTTDVDFKVTSYLSILAILILVAITFKSVAVPILLVATIELAILINQGIPYFTGSVVAFVAPTVIGCVQLGATVDYAILMTTRFQEELQKGKDRLEAIQTATVSSMDIVKDICLMLSRGAIISALVSIFILPSVLAAFEPLIAKTTLHWRTPKPPKTPKIPVLQGKESNAQ